MKEPVLVTLIVRLDDQEEEYQSTFPIRKSNMMYYVTRERLIRYFIIQKIIQQKDENQIVLQFFDHSTQSYQDEFKLKGIANNLEFTEAFLNHQNELKLIVMLFYDLNYAQLREINQTIEVFEKEKIANQHAQNILKKEFDDQQQQFLRMKQELDEIKNKVTELKTQKQKETYDLVILYSNPILRIKEGIQPALIIDYKTEIDAILTSIQVNGLTYKILKANADNLEKALNYEPQVLHLIVHGDFDRQKESFYFDFQEDGIVQQLQSEEFQRILVKEKEKQKTKLICISSIIGKNIADFIPKDYSSVVYMKMYNTQDQLGEKFWQSFYQKLSGQTSLQESFEIAEKQLAETFDKLKDKEKKTCCCVHFHVEGCIFDPAKIGFEENHSSHLSCVDQQFLHDYNNCIQFRTKEKSNIQCGNLCLGLLKHKFVASKCKNTGQKECQNYWNRICKFANAMGVEEEDGIRDLQFQLILNVNNFYQACCCEITLRLKEYLKNKNQSDTQINQCCDHSVWQKAQKIQVENGFFKLNPFQTIDKVNQSSDQSYQSPNKQIILIHNQGNHSQMQDQVIKAIKAYFENYQKILNKDRKLIVKELNFELYNNQNWKPYVAEQLNFLFNEDTFFQELEKYFQELKNLEQKNHNIFIFQHIDKIYESNLFKEFYRHFQELISSNFILILTVDNIIKKQLKSIIVDAEVQLIDLDLVQGQVEKEKQLIQVDDVI